MTAPATAAVEGPSALVARAIELRKRNDWPAIAAWLSSLPRELDGAWLPVADHVAFALGQLARFRDAIELVERTRTAEPSTRRDSALAYLCYAALLAQKAQKRDREAVDAPDREILRSTFRSAMGATLRAWPDSIKDLYRLGVYEAQIESRHDAVALRVLERAISSYRALSDEERERRHDFRKSYVRALYAAGRSALRLRDAKRARRYAFACVREDEGRDHVAPLHKLHLAAKVCLATGELDHAERACRLALEGKGPPARDFVYGTLAAIASARGDHDAAVRWIDANVSPHRRSAAMWRQLGDARLETGDRARAMAAWQAGLLKDRAGRHLTLVRIGRAQLLEGKSTEALRSFRQACDFRRRHYASEDLPALEGMWRALEALGQSADAAEVRERWLRAHEAAGSPPPGSQSWPPKGELRKAAGDDPAALDDDDGDAEGAVS